MSAPVVVGIDAGGSGTAAVAACGEQTLGSASGPPANLRTSGVEAAADAIAEVVRASLRGSVAAALCVGAAGAWDERLADELRAALAARFDGARIEVSHDARIALRAAVPDGDGLVLVAGTGSIAYGEVGGSRHRAGGYGYALGDEGSGYAIGAAGLRLLLRSFDGRVPRDAMLDALAAESGATGGRDLVARLGTGETFARDVARFAPIVLEFANRGERSANKIVQAAALDAFELLRALVRLAGAQERELPVALAGGLLRENSVLSYLIETRIAGDFPNLQVRKGGLEPQYAALAAARAATA